MIRMTDELPIRLPPLRAPLKPETAVGRAAPLLAVGIAIPLTFVARFGFDFGAWQISLSYIDCSAISLLLFGLPFAWVLNSVLRLINFSSRFRVALFVVLALLCGLLAGTGDSFRDVIGIAKPPGTIILSDRSFETPAGGGESYQYLQFTLGSDQQFEELLASQGFVLSPFDDWETLRSLWRNSNAVRTSVIRSAS